MDGDGLSSSSLSSSAVAEKQRDSSLKSDSSLPRSQQGHKSSEDLWTDDVRPAGDRLLSAEEQVTLITESMTVTSTDQEKLLLLNKNTELRRVNKELMKLNVEWDQVYRSTTLGLQHRLEGLELENTAIKQINTGLLLKAEHQQSAKEYYEQELMLQLKKNQKLQEYISRLESRMHHRDRAGKQDTSGAGMVGPELFPTNDPPRGPDWPQSSRCVPASFFSPAPSSPKAWLQGKSRESSTRLGALGDYQQELQALKEQLEAMRCQTAIYEAEYQTEHKDHKHTEQENRRLRRKREETRQQVALLQEQLKVYEDDFRRERSDKQMLQRLLLKKRAPIKDPVLIHRCNNEQQPPGGDKWTQS